MKYQTTIRLTSWWVIMVSCGTDTPTGNGNGANAPGPVVLVSVTPETTTLISLGETVDLTAVARDAAGAVVSSASFAWSSSDATTATVSSVGLVTAVSNGTVTVTVTSNGVNGTSAVEVDQTPGRLAFRSQPTATFVGAAIDPAVEIMVQDDLGNLVADADEAMTIFLGANTTGAALSGATQQATVAGVASFPDLSLDLPGTAYTLIAQYGSLPERSSVDFNVVQRILAAFGTPTIDGVLAANEWSGAPSMSFAADLPADDGGGTVDVEVWFMSDATSLYLAMQVSRPSNSGALNAFFDFENDHDEEREQGDDNVGAGFGAQQAAEVLDNYWTSLPPCPTNAVCAERDESDGGSSDGTAAFTGDATHTYLELSHPLDSPDDDHDFSLAPGDIVGFNVELRINARDPDCFQGANLDLCIATTYFPSPHPTPFFGDYGDLVLARP